MHLKSLLDHGHVIYRLKTYAKYIGKSRRNIYTYVFGIASAFPFTYVWFLHKPASKVRLVSSKFGFENLEIQVQTFWLSLL